MKVIQQKFQNEINERIKDQMESLVENPAHNMHQYGVTCGRIQGLKEASRLLDDMWEQYFHTLTDEEKEML